MKDVEKRIRKAEIKIRLGDLLRQHRIKSGLKQRDIAKVLNISEASVSNVEQGVQAIYFDEIFDWIEAYQTTIDKVLVGIRKR